ncbi:hypothetical protein Syun_006129 [Stephania yunnanensis]|uniref:Uncharacterized protein n=1 Tax=Stephania yunnanensis TaxID=152371 RepID=A0AAP0PX96_9MAGN
MADITVSTPSTESTDVSASTMASQPATTPFNPFGNSLSQGITIKLDHDNFLLWRSIVTSFIKGIKFEEYLLGTKARPQQFLDASGTINPDYEDWVSKDQMLISWLLNSLTLDIAQSVHGHVTSADTWKAIEALCGAHNRAKVQLSRTGLQTTRKGALSMSEYLTKMKRFSDSLSTAGSPVSNQDLISCTLAGLDGDYLSITTLLQDKEGLSWAELQASLLSFEAKLAQLQNLHALASLSVNSSPQTCPTSNPSAHFSQHRLQPSSNGQQSYPPRGRGGGHRGRGRGGRFLTNSNKPTCQICGKTGHSAAVCYHRNNPSYMGSIPTAPSQLHMSRAPAGPPPTTFVATSPSISDASWYFDSGATNHLTSDPDVLSSKSSYTGHPFQPGSTSGVP